MSSEAENRAGSERDSLMAEERKSLHQRLVDRVHVGTLRRRLIGWAVLGGLVVFMAVWQGAAYSREIIQSMFEGKLAVLAVILALGTFQYELLHRMIEKYAAQLDSAGWRQYFERIEAIPPEQRTQPVIDEYNRNRERWQRHLNQWRQYIREGIIVHNFAVLSNVIAIAGALFVSVVADAIVLYIADAAATVDWRSISTGALWFSGLPFLGMTMRYVMSLAAEEREHYRIFGEGDNGPTR